MKSERVHLRNDESYTDGVSPCGAKIISFGKPWENEKPEFSTEDIKLVTCKKCKAKGA